MTELWYTVGPSSLDRAEELLAAGATGARLTFSFGSTQLQLERAVRLRRASEATGLPCKVIADLPGGKVRLGTFSGPPSLPVAKGDAFRLRETGLADPLGDRVLPVPNPGFIDGLRPGDLVAVGDGALFLEVVRVGAPGVEVAAVSDGEIQHHRGLTVQSDRSAPVSVTELDRGRLREIAGSAVIDAVAFSFVGRAADLVPAKEIHGLEVIAKIETAGGLRNLPEICSAADRVLAARGDLALSVPWVELPGAVRRIAVQAQAAATPWHLATQIAEGSARDGFPTRAEICDLAHWCAEGCAGALLSYETAFGRDPVAAVRHTAEILRRWSGRP